MHWNIDSAKRIHGGTKRHANKTPSAPQDAVEKNDPPSGMRKVDWKNGVRHGLPTAHSYLEKSSRKK